MWFMAVRINGVKDKVKMTRDDINELCKKYPLLRQLGGGYMVQAQNDHFSFPAGPEQT